MTDTTEPTPKGPPKTIGRMARREMRFAYSMLAPTFLIVLAVVLMPLIANFWISFKPLPSPPLNRKPTAPTAQPLPVRERLPAGRSLRT